MKPVHLVVAAVLLVGLGAAWWLLGGGAPSEPRPQPEVVAKPSRGNPEMPPEPRRGEVVPDAAPRSQAPRAERSTEVARDRGGRLPADAALEPGAREQAEAAGGFASGGRTALERMARRQAQDRGERDDDAEEPESEHTPAELRLLLAQNLAPEHALDDATVEQRVERLEAQGVPEPEARIRVASDRAIVLMLAEERFGPDPTPEQIGIAQQMYDLIGQDDATRDRLADRAWRSR